MMRPTLLLILTAVPLVCGAQQPAAAEAESKHGLWRVASLPYDNPAVNQWRMHCGLTEVGASYASRSENTAVDPRLGDGSWQASAGAATYTKYANSTLWGHGSYSRSKTLNVLWNETADLELIYPYTLADSIGGNLDSERYSFSGGYAAAAGRWAWGGELSYTATLSYRAVDPRPRNVTGELRLAAGAGYRVAASYYAAASFSFTKYKQTNEIAFKSEMGSDKIFHTTGMATHYARFAGTGLSAYYNGVRYGVSADIWPSDGKGAFLSCALARFSFDNILSDLNKLPMASAWHKSIAAQGGWMHRSERAEWGASATLEAYRRHGRENIFGDAASSVYPQIGSIEMFADNYCSLGAKGMWGRRYGEVSRFMLTAAGGWQRRTTAYVEPWRYTQTNTACAELSAGGDLLLGRGWVLGADLAAEAFMPFGCSAQFNGTGTDPEAAVPEAIERHIYELASRSSGVFAVGLSAGRSVKRYMVRIAGGWRRHAYTEGLCSDSFECSLAFIF